MHKTLTFKEIQRKVKSDEYKKPIFKQEQDSITENDIIDLIKQHMKKAERYTILKELYKGINMVKLENSKVEVRLKDSFTINSSKEIIDKMIGHTIGSGLNLSTENEYEKELYESYKSELGVSGSEITTAEYYFIFGEGYEIITSSINDEPVVIPVSPLDGFPVYDNEISEKTLDPWLFITYKAVEDSIKSYTVYTRKYYATVNINEKGDFQLISKEVNSDGVVPVSIWKDRTYSSSIEDSIATSTILSSALCALNRELVIGNNTLFTMKDMGTTLTTDALRDDEVLRGDTSKIVEEILENDGLSIGAEESSGVDILKTNSNFTPVELLIFLKRESITSSGLFDIDYNNNNAISGVAVETRLKPVEYLMKVKRKGLENGYKRRNELIFKIIYNKEFNHSEYSINFTPITNQNVDKELLKLIDILSKYVPVSTIIEKSGLQDKFEGVELSESM